VTDFVTFLLINRRDTPEQYKQWDGQRGTQELRVTVRYVCNIWWWIRNSTEYQTCPPSDTRRYELAQNQNWHCYQTTL